MRITWFGISAFLIESSAGRVFIDPYGLMAGDWMGPVVIDYDPVSGVEADLLLITHEHRDHNHVEGVVGDPEIVRSRAGVTQSRLGEVIGVNSDHDDVAGTRLGSNTMYAFELDGLRLAHLGDLGQPRLRPEQCAALGDIDVLMLPAGGAPSTITGVQAAEVVAKLEPRVAIPMHYRTEAMNFLDTVDAFLEASAGQVTRVAGQALDVDYLLAQDGRLTAVPDAPARAGARSFAA
jgi:L-ascorbate metabolism protein UlaG (beta-lactamase superfamily)